MGCKSEAGDASVYVEDEAPAGVDQSFREGLGALGWPPRDVLIGRDLSSDPTALVLGFKELN